MTTRSPFAVGDPRNPRIMAWLTLVALLGLTGCQPTFVLNQLTPRDDFVVQRDLVYGPDPRQRLDLYLPSTPSTNRAVVVFIHGGGWDSGDKDQYLFVGQAFASLGYVTAIPNYRLYPQVQFPAFIDDVALAVAALQRVPRADACTGQLQVILVGHSAGAHSAAMLATDQRYLARNRADVDVRALIGLAGPYDLPLDDPGVIGKFDNLAHTLEANPVALASDATPQTLLIHGDADTIVGLHHTRRFQARLVQLGVPTTVRIYPGTNHTRVVGSLASALRFLNPARDDIAQFLERAQLDRHCHGRADDAA
ncbi:MAG: alpha/beta hydrolase [Gammaproteobacteria bacterium]|nr:alpha/beta hydrolase [Gammaproteobacteria bacterium]